MKHGSNTDKCGAIQLEKSVFHLCFISGSQKDFDYGLNSACVSWAPTAGAQTLNLPMTGAASGRRTSQTVSLDAPLPSGRPRRLRGEPLTNSVPLGSSSEICSVCVALFTRPISAIVGR